MENNNRKTKQGSDAIEEIKKLLPDVLNKMFPVPIEKLNWFKTIWHEVGEACVDEMDVPLRQLCDHFPQISPVSEQDFIDHFSRKIIVGSMHEEDDIVGWELCVDLKHRETNHIKSLCLRAWEVDRNEIKDKLLPKLDEYGVEYLIIRVVNEIRLWIFCDTCVSLAGQFINKIVHEANGVWCYSLDIYPIHSFFPIAPGIPGGHSGSVEFRGITSSNPIFIMKSILLCKPVPEIQMLAALQKPVEHKSI